MRQKQLKAIGLSVVLASVFSLGLMSPETGFAWDDRQDLCHLRYDGSYRKIPHWRPILWWFHHNHGDAEVGEAVPGMDGYVFDEDCNVVPSGIAECPCASSGTAVDLYDSLRLMNFDVEPPLVECGGEADTAFVNVSDSNPGGAEDPPFMSVDVDIINGDYVCRYRLADELGDNVSDVLLNPITDTQAEACRADILTLQDELQCR